MIPEFSGLKSGWLKGRKGSVEGWFPVDFVMPVLSEVQSSSTDESVETERQSADYINVADNCYSNLPTQYVVATTVITRNAC